MYAFVNNKPVNYFDKLGLEDYPIVFNNYCVDCHPGPNPFEGTNYNINESSFAQKIKEAYDKEVGLDSLLSARVDFTLLWIPHTSGYFEVSATVSGECKACCHVKTNKVGTMLELKASVTGTAALGLGAGGNMNKTVNKSERGTRLRNRKTNTKRNEKGGAYTNDPKPTGAESSSIGGLSLSNNGGHLPPCENKITGSLTIELGAKAGFLLTFNPYINGVIPVDEPIRIGYGVRTGFASYVGAEAYISATGTATLQIVK